MGDRVRLCSLLPKPRPLTFLGCLSQHGTVSLLHLGRAPTPQAGCRIKGTPTLWAIPAREKVRTAQSCGEMTVPGPPYPSTALGDQEPVPRVAFAPHGAGGWEWFLAQKPQVVTALTKMQ